MDFEIHVGEGSTSSVQIPSKSARLSEERSTIDMVFDHVHIVHGPTLPPGGMFGPTVYDTGSRRRFRLEERERTPVTEEMSCSYDHEFIQRSRSRSSKKEKCDIATSQLPSSTEVLAILNMSMSCYVMYSLRFNE